MKPVEHGFIPGPGVRRVTFTGPEGSGLEPLPAAIFEDEILTLWEPSPADKAAIAGGARIELWIRGASLPPVGLKVQGVR